MTGDNIVAMAEAAVAAMAKRDELSAAVRIRAAWAQAHPALIDGLMSGELVAMNAKTVTAFFRALGQTAMTPEFAAACERLAESIAPTRPQQEGS